MAIFVEPGNLQVPEPESRKEAFVREIEAFAEELKHSSVRLADKPKYVPAKDGWALVKGVAPFERDMITARLQAICDRYPGVLTKNDPITVTVRLGAGIKESFVVHPKE